MKLLLDESLPRRLKSLFADHETRTVPEMGWQGTKNGELIRLAAAEFDVFLTADQNLQYQQNLVGVDIHRCRRLTDRRSAAGGDLPASQ